MQIDSLARVSLGICLFNSATGIQTSVLPPSSGSYLPPAYRLLQDVDQATASIKQAFDQANVVKPTAMSIPVGSKQRSAAVYCAQVLAYAAGLKADLVAGLAACESLEQEVQQGLQQVSRVYMGCCSTTTPC